MTFKISVRGGLSPPICSQIKKYLKLIQGWWGQYFSKNSEIKKNSEISNLIGNFSQMFPYFYFYTLS